MKKSTIRSQKLLRQRSLKIESLEDRRMLAGEGLLDPTAVTDPASSVTASTIHFQDGVDGYTGTQDTKIKAAKPSANYADRTGLRAADDKSSLIRWDLATIPAAAVVQSASITLNVTDPSADDFFVYAMRRNWSETQATWNQAASGAAWDTPGAAGNSDHDAIRLGAFQGNSRGAVSVELNAAGLAQIQSWIDDPNTNQGVVLQNYAAHDQLGYTSRETSEISQRPQLSVSYTVDQDPPDDPQDLPPLVNAGPNQTVVTGDDTLLQGNIDWNEGPGPLVATWSVVSGPGTVQLGNESAASTTARFDTAGSYLLRLSADNGYHTASDELTVTVTANDPNPTLITVSFQQGVDGYRGTQDTKLKAAKPSANYSGNSTLRAARDQSSLIRWDLATIPTDAVLQAAAITLTVSDASLDEFPIYAVLRDWSETQATWNQAASGVPWETPGASGSGDHSTTSLGTFRGNSLGAVSVDLNPTGLAQLQSWINNPNSNRGVALQNYGASDKLGYYSREASNNSQRPQLRISYTVGQDPPDDPQDVPPTVNAGPDQNVTTEDDALLQGNIDWNDGPGPLEATWSVVSGPAAVQLDDPLAAITTASFHTAGSYVLRLSANNGSQTASDELTVTVTAHDPNPSPITISFQQGVDGYTGTLDTKLKSTKPSANFADKTTLRGDREQSSLIRWDLATIPSGMVLQTAAITLTVTDTSADEFPIYAMLREWSETQASWNQAASGTPWETPGANGHGDHNMTSLGSFRGHSTGAVTVALNPAGLAQLQSWIDDPNSNQGVILQNYGAGDKLGFYSREASDPSLRPQLTITYQAAGDSPNSFLEERSGGVAESQLFSGGLPTIPVRQDFVQPTEDRVPGSTSSHALQFQGSRTTRDSYTLQVPVVPETRYRMQASLKIANRATYSYANLNYPWELASRIGTNHGIWGGRYGIELDGFNILNPVAYVGDTASANLDWFVEQTVFETTASQTTVSWSIVLEGFDGQLLVDDVTIQEVEILATPTQLERAAIRTPFAGMQVLEHSDQHVQTTAALFEFDERHLTLTKGTAVVSVIDFGPQFLSGLSATGDAGSVKLENANLTIWVSADSVVLLELHAPALIQVSGSQQPYSFFQAGTILTASREEGIAFTPVRSRVELGTLPSQYDSATRQITYDDDQIASTGRKTWNEVSPVDPESGSDWLVDYYAIAGDVFAAQVVPSRPVDVDDFFALELNTLGTINTVTNPEQDYFSVLAAFAAAGKNVALVLRPQYAIADLGGLPVPEDVRFLSDVAGPYQVANPDSVRRLVDEAHLQGIKVVTYVSPYYYYTTDVSLFVENVLAIRDQTGIDGVYLDGLYRNDFMASREVMVQLRTALGADAFIALHHSKDTVLRTDIKTPFFETLADVVWTGENVSTLTLELATLDAASGTLQVFLPETRSDAEGNPLPIEAQIDLLLAQWIKVRRVGVLDRTTGTRSPFPSEYYDAALADLWDSVTGP